MNPSLREGEQWRGAALSQKKKSWLYELELDWHKELEQ